MNENQLRKHYVDTLRGWLGRKEDDGSHRLIIDTYNNMMSLPRNYRVTYTDAWCAATVSAAAIEAGVTDIIPRECSCAKMIERFKDMKRWMERDDYTPQPGDIIFYDWQDSGKGDNVGAADHVGVVESVAGGVITVIEGNYHDAVGRRNIHVNGRYIRGYGLPDYASMSDSPPPPTVIPEAHTPDLTPQTNAGRIRAMTNAALADLLTNPPDTGGKPWIEWLDSKA